MSGASGRTVEHANPAPAASVGIGTGRVETPSDRDCGEPFFNADQSYETGFTWQYGGIQAPDYGSFAERYTGEVSICSVVIDLTQTGYQSGQTLDVYIWEDENGQPGAVHSVERGLFPGAVAFWPDFSRHAFPIAGTPGDPWWVGYWGSWPGGFGAYFVGADLDGPGGTPFTRIAPGLEYPSGWQNVSVVWGPVQSISIGAEGTALEQGACCFVDGNCALRRAEECDGDYHGEGTRCTPNPCPRPPDGACCMPDGRCSVFNEYECEDHGGIFEVEQVCEPNPCPQPPDGACCLESGVCLFVSVYECDAAGGTYTGDLPCEPNPCPQPPGGACCLPDGSCLFVDVYECSAAGGAHTVDLPCDPNPCPQPPAGACCRDGVNCVLVSAFECTSLAGHYLGDDSACDPNPCADGACCFGDGSCAVTGPADCESSGGSYRGGGTLCDPNPCPQPVIGACCMGLEGCVEMSEIDCERDGGTFQGEGTLCASTFCPIPCPTPEPRSTRSPATIGRAGEREGEGPNAGGTLILHRNPDLEFTTIDPFCERAELASCSESNSRVDVSTPVVFHVLTAFPTTSQPRLAGITFGIEYPDCVVMLAAGRCASFELDDPDWPNPGTGTALTWIPPREDHLVTIYWFAAYVADEQTAWVDVIPHPNHGGWFADDAIPSRLDPIADYGRLGFFMDGFVPCPIGEGACCFADGVCVVTTADDCEAEGGEFQGESACEPNPCTPTATIEASWGQVKARFR